MLTYIYKIFYNKNKILIINNFDINYYYILKLKKNIFF